MNLRRLLSRTLLLLPLLTLLFLPSSASAYAHWEGYCQQGGQIVMGPGGSQSTTKVQQSYPQATLTVYLSGVTPQTKATLYSDNAGTPLANPLTCSTKGYFSFYAVSGVMDLTFSGTGISAPFTWGAVSGVEPINQVSDAANPSANLSTLCTQAAAISGALLLSIPHTLTGSTDLSGCVVEAQKGGVIITGSYTLTLGLGKFSGDATQHFNVSGGGAVVNVPAGPWQWFGVVGDDSTNNATTANAALANMSVVQIPFGTYRFGSTLVAPLNGQKILCDDPETTILKFTGASSGIDMYRAGAAQKFTEVSRCNFQTTNASGNSALIIDADNSFPSSNVYVHDNWVTTSGAGVWNNGIRLIANQGSVLARNWVYGEVAHPFVLGNGGVAVTHVKMDHNVIGAVQATSVGVTLNFAQDVVSSHDYCQSSPLAQCFNVDAASELTVDDDTDCDIPLNTATNCLYSEGAVKINSMRITGTYTRPIVAQNGTMNIQHLFFSGSASAEVVKFATSNPGSGIANSRITNTHATGNGINVTFGTNDFVKDNYISTVGGTPVVMGNGSLSTLIDNNELRTSTGKGVSMDNSVNTWNMTNNKFYGVTRANACGNCDWSSPPILNGSGNWVDGVGYLLDASYIGADVTSASTIVPTGPMFHVTGTTSTSVMTPPYAGYAGCVTIIADGAWPWATGGGAGGFNSSGTATAGRAYRFCYDGNFAKRLWYQQ